MDNKLSQELQWYALHTNPKQEERAHQNLQAWGLESLNPKLKERRLNPFTGAPVYVTKPLFPRYIFARFGTHILHKIYFTAGVHSVVSFNGVPTAIDDEIIDLIKARVGPDGFVKAQEELQDGDKVVITAGTMQGLVGISQDVNDSDRVTILLTAIKYQGCLVVAKDSVRKAAAASAH